MKTFSKLKAGAFGGVRPGDDLGWKTLRITCEATVFWGIHNEVVGQWEVLPGYLLFVSDSVGDWHEVLPKYAGQNYWEVLEDSDAPKSGEARGKINRRFILSGGYRRDGFSSKQG